MKMKQLLLRTLLGLLLFSLVFGLDKQQEVGKTTANDAKAVDSFFLTTGSNHTNNWAVSFSFY
jgi:hypothetical protein